MNQQNQQNQQNQNQEQQNINSDNPAQGPIDTTDVSNTIKDPDDWKTSEDLTQEKHIRPNLDQRNSGSGQQNQQHQANRQNTGSGHTPDISNTIKDPDEWKTGDEPMTGAQRSYLQRLSDEAKVPFDENLTKADASKRIDELQQLTGRGQNQRSGETDSDRANRNEDTGLRGGNSSV
jgi:hypothetical protein